MPIRGDKTEGEEMTYNIILTGVGGEGVLITSAIVARAANYDGHKVGGIQLHGLAQRGGSIPTYVRFGKEIHSPSIRRGEADLIIGLETIEAARECHHASKNRTHFIIDTYTIKPVYTHLFKQKYPSIEEVKKMVKPFAKSVTIMDASNITDEKLGGMIYGNVMTLGVAYAKGVLPLSKKSLVRSIKETIPRALKENLKAFEMGIEFE